MVFPLHALFRDLPLIDIVDVGASPIDGPPAYQRLLDVGAVGRLTGFEPNLVEWQKLQAQGAPGRQYLPYAIGDGKPGVLRVCQAPGMTSLFEPDMTVLEHFHGFPGWSTVVKRVPIETRRLDDVCEIGAMDYLKLDVQAGELSVLQGATRLLASTLVIHTEAQNVPYYVGQPMFGEIDTFLRQAGFLLHCFTRIDTRTLQPVLVNNDPRAGLNQIVEFDAVYVRSFTSFNQIPINGLLKIARIVHDLYSSYDLAHLALKHVDAISGSSLQEQYLAQLILGVGR
jgi:FkbM family methyltransferase